MWFHQNGEQAKAGYQCQNFCYKTIKVVLKPPQYDGVAILCATPLPQGRPSRNTDEGKGFHQVEPTLLFHPFSAMQNTDEGNTKSADCGSTEIQMREIQKWQMREKVPPICAQPPLTFLSFSLLLIYADLAHCEDYGSCTSCNWGIISLDFYDFPPPPTLFLILPPIFLSHFFGPA